MSEPISAIFINGVFRPEQPVDIADGQRVLLTVKAKPSTDDDLSDVLDLLDTEFMAACRQNTGQSPTLEAVRQTLGEYAGSISDLICRERDER